MDAGGQTPGNLIGMLSKTLDRHVFDKTGITDVYTFHLRFAHDGSTPGNLPPQMTERMFPRTDLPSGPSIFTALEQRGPETGADTKGRRDTTSSITSNAPRRTDVPDGFEIPRPEGGATKIQPPQVAQVSACVSPVTMRLHRSCNEHGTPDIFELCKGFREHAANASPTMASNGHYEKAHSAADFDSGSGDCRNPDTRRGIRGIAGSGKVRIRGCLGQTAAACPAVLR